MSVYLKLCANCRRKERPTVRRGRKSCSNCKWIAVTAPKLGRKSLGVFNAKADADAADQQALSDHRRGIDLLPRNVTVANVVERYLTEGTVELSPTTLHRYRELWNIHGIPLAKHAISDLRKPHITGLYTALQRKPRGKRGALAGRTVLHFHRVLHRAFKWAVTEDIIGSNIFANVALPKAKESDARSLSYDEADEFFAAAKGTKFEEFFDIAILTAARRGEMCALKWDSVDLDAARVTIRSSLASTRVKKKARADGAAAVLLKGTKSGRSRVVPLDADAIEAFRRLSARRAADRLRHGANYCDQGFVFADALGRPIKLDAPTKAFRDIAVNAKLSPELTRHSLRHSFASWALPNGADIISVQRIMGHSVPSTTLNLYSHAVEGGREKAVGAASDTLRRIKGRRADGGALKASETFALGECNQTATTGADLGLPTVLRCGRNAGGI